MTFATPWVVLMNPDIAALNAVLVRVRTLVASRPRMMQVRSRRLVQAVMTFCFPSF